MRRGWQQSNQSPSIYQSPVTAAIQPQREVAFTRRPRPTPSRSPCRTLPPHMARATFCAYGVGRPPTCRHRMHDECAPAPGWCSLRAPHRRLGRRPTARTATETPARFARQICAPDRRHTTHQHAAHACDQRGHQGAQHTQRDTPRRPGLPTVAIPACTARHSARLGRAAGNVARTIPTERGDRGLHVRVAVL